MKFVGNAFITGTIEGYENGIQFSVHGTLKVRNNKWRYFSITFLCSNRKMFP